MEGKSRQRGRVAMATNARRYHVCAGGEGQLGGIGGLTS